tara:strand:+ start:577 stop:834 length:258 start_codon:yes stop_codon:yes gene_type:complete
MASSRNNTLEFSSAGSQVLGGGDDLTATIGAVQVINDTVLEILSSVNINVSQQALTGATLPAGTIIYGQISRVKLTSGLVVCHRV